MTLDYNKEIFKYPSVQYIPLQIKELKEGKASKKLSTRFYIYLAEDNEILNNRLKKFEIDTPYKINEGEVAILLINGRVNLVKYRGYEVLMVGERKNTLTSIFKLTTKYFYKNKIIFSLYDYVTAEKLDREFIKQKGRW